MWKICYIYHLNHIKFNSEFWFHWTCQKFPSQLLLGLPPCVGYWLLCNKPLQHLQAYNSNHSCSREPAIWTKLSRDSLCLLHLVASETAWLDVGEFACKMAHFSGCPVGASCCWEFSGLWVGGLRPSLCGLLRGTFGFFHGMALGSKIKKLEEPDRNYINFYDLSLGVTKCHSVSPQFLPDSAGGETIGGELTRQPSLENTICHSPNRKVTWRFESLSKAKHWPDEPLLWCAWTKPMLCF